MKVEKLSAEAQAAFAELRAAEEKLASLGFNLHRHLALHTLNEDSWFDTRIRVAGNTEPDHAFADAVRDISTAWNNDAHPAHALEYAF